MLRYAIYTRKSDDDRSVTEKSIAEQVFECERIVERDNLTVVRQWEESRSAKTPRRRAGFSQMIQLIEVGEVDAIVCWHINRLVRNMEEGGHLAQLLIDGKIREIRTPAAIYRTGDNIMPLVIEAASATQFSLDHSRTVTRGMMGSFRKGGCLHVAPQGYINRRDLLNLKRGFAEPDPERFDTIRRAWDLMLRGTYTVRKVCDTLNHGWGYRARPSRKRTSPRPLSYNGLMQVFSNPFYAGFVRRNGELVPGQHVPMVTIDEFERVQEILGRRTFSAPRRRDHPFTGLMRCVHCGQSITAEVTRLRDGRLWPSYHCSDARNRCTKKGLSEAKVRAMIAAEFQKLEVDPPLLELALGALQEYLRGVKEQSTKTTTDLEAALSRMDARLTRLDDMWLDGLLTDSGHYNGLRAREIARKSEVMKLLQRAGQEVQHMSDNASRAFAFIRRIGEEIHSPDPYKVRALCVALGTSYAFDGVAKTIQITLHPLLVELVKFSREIALLEPSDNGSRKLKELPKTMAVHSGGTERCGLEPSPNLLECLKGDLFPDPWAEAEKCRQNRLKALVASRCRKSSRLDSNIEALLL